MAVGDAVEAAVGVALGEALGEEDSEVSSGVVERMVLGACLSLDGGSGRVFSLAAGAVDGDWEAGFGVSRNSRTAPDRAMAPAYTPTSKIGASATVSA